MRSWIPCLLAAGWLVATAACSSNPVPEVPGPNDSIVFGHFDMSDAPVNMTGLWMQQFSPPTENPYWSFGIEDGTFYNWYIDPGSYAVSSFAGSGGRTRYRFNIPRQMKELRLKVDKPGIYFLGSWRYKDIETGFFDPAKFDLERTDTPTERELVEKLIKVVKGTAVEPKLRAYLKELK